MDVSPSYVVQPRARALDKDSRFEYFHRYSPDHAIIESFLQSDRSVLFIHGLDDLGKTALLQAVGHQALDRNPSSSVIYLTLEDYMAEFRLNTRRPTQLSFSTGAYRSSYLLLIGGFEQLCKYWALKTEEELKYNIDDRLQSGRKIVFASSQSPREMLADTDALGSRLVSGYVARLLPPSETDRREIIDKMAARERMCFSDEVRDYLAANIESVRGLHEAVCTLCASASFDRTDLSDLQLVSELTRGHLGKRPTREPSLDDIIRNVSLSTGTTATVILGDSRERAVCCARRVIVALAREWEYSLERIAQKLNRDHSTVMAAIRSHENELAKKGNKDQVYLDRVRRELKGS